MALRIRNELDCRNVHHSCVDSNGSVLDDTFNCQVKCRLICRKHNNRKPQSTEGQQRSNPSALCIARLEMLRLGTLSFVVQG